MPGIADGARLVVRGPNVMLGYLRAESPGVLQPPDGGWYDTGDIVAIDADGFVTIKGRAKRFAKVAGEMVPLGAVEEFVGKVWPDAAHAVVAIPDDKRGEQVVLVTDQKDAARAALHGGRARGGRARDVRAARHRQGGAGADPRHRQDRLRVGGEAGGAAAAGHGLNEAAGPAWQQDRPRRRRPTAGASISGSGASISHLPPILSIFSVRGPDFTVA